MLFRLLGKTVWFSGKMVVKHVLVPIAITAATAVVLEKLVERLDKEPNGSVGRPSRPMAATKANA